MTMKTRAGVLFENMGGATSFGTQAAMSKQAPAVALREADDFDTADEMVKYLEDNMPKALKAKGLVYIKASKGFGRHGEITVKYVSTDYRDMPRKNNIEHNAFYRLIFIMHQQPETPDPRSKLKFETVTGVASEHVERGVKKPRLMPQKTFRDAADKLLAWFKKNEKALLDWPTDESLTNEGIGSGRDYDGSASVYFAKELLAEVPVFRGDRAADIRMRALDHIRKNNPSKILKALHKVTIKHRGRVLESVDLTGTEELMLTKAYTDKRGTVTGQLVSGTGKKGGRVKTGIRQFDAMKSLIDKGLLKKIGSTSEKETKRGFTVTFMHLQGEITDAGKAYFEQPADEALEPVSEGRVGRFYPTAPNLTRRQFIETMLGLLQELNVTATQTSVNREAVTKVMAKADNALMDWMLKEHKGMLARMHDADQVAYRAELRDIEARLKQLRAARDVSWDKMSEIIQSAIELYGF